MFHVSCLNETLWLRGRFLSASSLTARNYDNDYYYSSHVELNCEGRLHMLLFVFVLLMKHDNYNYLTTKGTSKLL